LVRTVAVRQVWDVWDAIPEDADPSRFQTNRNGDVLAFTYGDAVYRRLPSQEWIPLPVYSRVRQNPGADLPLTAEAYYRRDIEHRWFRPAVIVPIFFCVFVLLLYLLGKIIAARVGRALWNYFERLIHHLPFISTVYGTVKKVTDIVFTEAELEFNRVVAVEYPRRGIWSVGFVTGESLPAIRAAASEPILSVLMPTSPMPATGFTISVRKGETVELNISVDQAFQFIVSCGVVVPGLVTSQDESSDSVAAQVREAVADHQAPQVTTLSPPSRAPIDNVPNNSSQ
jgi:uncharacterized membrane protein